MDLCRAFRQLIYLVFSQWNIDILCSLNELLAADRIGQLACNLLQWLSHLCGYYKAEPTGSLQHSSR